MNCLQRIVSEEILVNHQNIPLEVSRKQGINIPKEIAIYNLVIITNSYKLFL